jgi:hypothetical protein
MADEFVRAVMTGYIQYAIRFGIVAENAPLSEIAPLQDVIPCPNPKCIGGGFEIRQYASGIRLERCRGYVRETGNMRHFCNYFIRYRVVYRENQNVTSG